MPVLTKDIVPGLVQTGASARVAADVAPRFKVGDRIRARNVNPAKHTRLPRYVRGKIGTIELDHGVFVLPDPMAHGGGETPQHVYNGRFTPIGFGGPVGSPPAPFGTDLWDAYIRIA